MYLDFFGLSRYPFHITPDPEFLFLSPTHREASAAIFYGIEQRKGFISITGEVGVGKTTILRAYLEAIDSKSIRIVYIFNASLSFESLLKQMLVELGLGSDVGDSSEMVNRLFIHLIEEYKENRTVVLIVDEAQNMPVETLEKLRMLSNLETSKEKLLQIVLVGQPEFEEKINLPELRQLKQRIVMRSRINALSDEQSLAYIEHRLEKANVSQNDIFTRKALDRIIREAKGVPRLINIICDNSLLTGFGLQRRPVDEEIVKEVINDINGPSIVRIHDSPSHRSGKQVFFRFAAASALLVIGLYAFLWRGDILSNKAQNAKEQVSLAPPERKDPAELERRSEVLSKGEQEKKEQVQVSLAPPERKDPAELERRSEVLNKGEQEKKEQVQVSLAPPERKDPAELERRSEVLSKGEQEKKEQVQVSSAPLDRKDPAELERRSEALNKGEQGKKEQVQPSADIHVKKSDPVQAAETSNKAVLKEVELQSEQIDLKLPKIGFDASSQQTVPSKSQPDLIKINPERDARKAYSTRIKKGECVSEVLTNIYGYVDKDLLKSFRDLNPQIKDINKVMEGEELFLPKTSGLNQ